MGSVKESHYFDSWPVRAKSCVDAHKHSDDESDACVRANDAGSQVAAARRHLDAGPWRKEKAGLVRDCVKNAAHSSSSSCLYLAPTPAAASGAVAWFVEVRYGEVIRDSLGREPHGCDAVCWRIMNRMQATSGWDSIEAHILSSCRLVKAMTRVLTSIGAILLIVSTCINTVN
ncbi:hypothetical protein MRX96_035552 [Rhipicephalus microplus]